MFAEKCIISFGNKENKLSAKNHKIEQERENVMRKK